MRVLITGIDGFVGSHAAELIKDVAGTILHGTIITASASPNIAHLENSLTLHQADVTDPDVINTLFENILPDRVMHIAGQAFVPAALKNPMATFQANIIGGLSILEAARKQRHTTGKSPAVLIISSGEVYGRIEPHQLPITEDTPLNPHNPYAASKASIDIIARQYAEHFGVNVTIVRPFNHAGPRQHPSFVVSDFSRQFALIAEGRQNPVIHVGDISVQRDFTDVRDVVRAYWLLPERHSKEIVFNVSSGQAIEISRILDLLQEISGLDVKITPEYRRLRSYDSPVVVASSERLHKATGWVPQIPFLQTLQDTYTYWLQVVRSESQAAPSS